MKKLCFITTVEGTQESFIIPALYLFKAQGYDITIMCAMPDDFYERYSKEYHCINVKMHRGTSVADLIRMPFVFYRIFRREHFDMVQYATPNASLYASFAAKWAKVPKRIYCQWGIRYVGCGGILRSVLKTFEKWTSRNSTHIRPASWKNLDYAVSEGLYRREKAAAIGDGGTVGVDLKNYSIEKKPTYKSEIKEKYPALKDKIVYCFVGRLSRDKGSFELLDAFRKLFDDRQDVALMLVGRAETEFPAAYSWVKDREDIVFTGSVPSNVVCQYMAAADVLVHPSYREGFSMVIQEAMAMGLPVVTTDIPGPSEVIEKEVTGILAKARDVDTLYECMKWMAENPEKRETMGLAGRKRCEDHFSRERMLKLTLEDREKILKD